MSDFVLGARSNLDVTTYSIGKGEGNAFAERVRNLSQRRIGSSIYYKNNIYRDASLMNNPLTSRYTKESSDIYNLENNDYESRGYQLDSLGGPLVGQRSVVYESDDRKPRDKFLDSIGGIVGYTEQHKLRQAKFDGMYSVSKIWGANSYELSESVAWGVVDIAKSQLGLQLNQTTYYPEVGDSAPTTYIYQEDHWPSLEGSEVHTIDGSNIEVLTSSTLTRYNGLLDATNKLFRNGRIGSLINRFQTNAQGDASEWKRGLLHSAFSKYGYSRGRNLLKKKPTNENSYDNPYCRVWTSHHQYSRMADRIRPFLTNDEGFMGVKELQKNYGILRGDSSVGSTLLSQYSVIDENGLPKIVPHKEDTDENITKYMFSIENLAWKDIMNSQIGEFGEEGEGEYAGKKVKLLNTYSDMLGKGQVGPNGGRIMWFPPYNLKFSENINANWNENRFIGRGEPIYTYTDTVRNGNLSFTILIDHPSVLNLFKRFSEGGQLVNDENEQKILRFFAGCENIGDDIKLKGYQADMTFVDKKTERSVTVEPIVTVDPLVNQSSNKDGGSEQPLPTDKEFECAIVVFFPNNLSCYDTSGLTTGSTFYWDSAESALKYLLDGQGQSQSDYGEAPDYGKAVRGYETLPIINTDEGILSGTNTDTSLCQNFKMDKRFEKERGTLWNKYKSDGAEAQRRNCCDTRSFGLNTTAFTEAISAFIANDGSYSGTAFSAKTISTDDLKTIMNIVHVENMQANQIITLDQLLEIKSKEDLIRLLTKGDFNVSGTTEHYRYSYEIKTTATVFGNASSHGYTSNNNELEDSRAALLKRYLLDKKIVDNNSDFESTVKTEVSVSKINNFDKFVSGLSAKAGRSACIKLKFKATVEATPLDENDNTAVRNLETTPVLEYKVNVNENTITTKTPTRRYDFTRYYTNEFEYFNRLEKDDHLLYTKICKKISYFNPAFHSITPEGFNARLTFLQQCMRPGPTSSASDKNGILSTFGAGNLSFGRAPYCVLRIGDFFHTKIVIENISIDYDVDGNVQWDMNQEGIGMQPMYANINMTIHFLGGSDMKSPVEELQNAISANYYANTSTYDILAQKRYIRPDEDSAVEREGDYSNYQYLKSPTKEGDTMRENDRRRQEREALERQEYIDSKLNNKKGPNATNTRTRNKNKS